MTFGELIRSERKKAGLTQTQLAERLGVTQSLIGQYERGEISPKTDTIKRICNALGIPTFKEQEDNVPLTIRELREVTFCTQEKLAQLSGLPLSTIQKYENGNIEPQIDDLDRIARALGVSANQLYDINSLPTLSGLDSEIRFIRNGGPVHQNLEIGRKAAAVVTFEDLNRDGQMCALELIKLVSKVPEYQRSKYEPPADNSEATP